MNAKDSGARLTESNEYRKKNWLQSSAQISSEWEEEETSVRLSVKVRVSDWEKGIPISVSKVRFYVISKGLDLNFLVCLCMWVSEYMCEQESGLF